MTTKVLQDKELQEHYEQLFAMFGTRGWARLQRQLDEMIQSFNSVAGVNTAEELWFRKGQLDQMLWLQSFAATNEHAYNELLAQQEGGDPAPATGGKARVTDGEDDGPLS